MLAWHSRWFTAIRGLFALLGLLGLFATKPAVSPKHSIYTAIAVRVIRVIRVII